MQKVYFYIGANNATGKLERDKAEEIIVKHFAEFSTYEIAGFWRGKKEPSLKVEILTEEPITKIAAAARDLKEALQQEAVLMEVVESNFALIQ